MNRTLLNSCRPTVERAKLRRFLVLTLMALFMVACKPPQPQGKRYDLKGTVVSIDKANKSATIDHEEIKDFMEAMVMPYAFKDTWALDVMKPGDRIQATVVVTDYSSWLEDVVIIQKSAPETAPPPGESSSLPKEGDAIPDFKLINQDSKRVQLSQYKGRAVLLTFIYTRCPLPEYCTLMSNNFSTIDRELKKDDQLYRKTHLLSVSFDPEYDTPKVLRSYGASHTGDYDKATFSHWEFVTGDKEEVKRIAGYFGLTYVPEKDQIVHSLKTALIGPDGKLVKLYSGNEWKPSEVLTDIRGVVGVEK